MRPLPGLATRRRQAPSSGILVLITVLLAAFVAACGGPVSTSPSASAVAPSVASSPDAGASSDAGAGPQPTSWPGGVVEAIVILGKADLQIKQAGGDLGAAAASEDLKALYGAADGLAVYIGNLEAQVDRIRDYPVTAAAVAAYDAAFPDMAAGARKMADSIKAGDSAGLTAGSAQLAKGTAAYEAARKEIGQLFETALLMQRILVK